MQLRVKRCVDVFVAVIMLICLAPVILIVACLVRTKLGSPILFRQERIGYQGQIFEMVKFRTMLNATDKSGEVLPDEMRLTRFGKLLRKSSLDELPELLNVLNGQMSLVGPRPLLVEYLPLYSQQQMRRHEMRPGITGYAQINGRNNISWAKKFELDVHYIDHYSLMLDFKILIQTIVKVVRVADIEQDGHVTIEKFNGTN